MLSSKHSLNLLTVVAAALLTACGNRPDSVAPLAVSAIAIATPDGAIPVTGTMQFVAAVTDANGNALTTHPVWTVVNGGGTITRDGLFTAGDSVGTFTNTIVATIGSVADSSTVTVSAGGLSNITITPATDTVAVDGMQEFAAVGHDAFGHVVDIPAGLVWSMSSPSAGTVDSIGYFSAGTVAGSYTLTATSGTVAGHASILVVAGPLNSIVVAPASVTLDQGATQQFTAVGKDAHNNVVAITPVWSVVLGGTINQSGLFTAGSVAGPFTNTVTATVGVISGSASVTVNPGPVATIVVTPATSSVFTGGTVQYTAVARDAALNVVPVVLTWSADPLAGTITSTGLFTASNDTGAYANAIHATSGSASGSATVTVMTPIIICAPVCGNPCFPMPFCGIP